MCRGIEIYLTVVVLLMSLEAEKLGGFVTDALIRQIAIYRNRNDDNHDDKQAYPYNCDA